MRNVTCYILFLCLMLFLAPLKAQTLRGRVADAQTGEPLPFATLRLGATGQGTVTEMNGSFSITGSGGAVIY